MKQVTAVMLVVVLTAAVLAACSQGNMPAATKAPGPAATQSGPSAQERWDSVVAAARKEGQLNLYVSANWGAELRTAMTRVLKEKYGIDAQFTPFGGSDIVARAREEQRAGMNSVDVFGAGTSFGGLAIPVKSPRPNAATVFVNWLLTKDGQSLFARYTGNPSRRLDASTEGVNPIFLPFPGEKVVWDTAEFTLANAKVMQAARDVLSEAQK